MGYKERVKVYWKNDEDGNWKTDHDSVAVVDIRGVGIYDFPVSEGGMKIKEIKFVGIEFPFSYNVMSIGLLKPRIDSL